MERRDLRDKFMSQKITLPFSNKESKLTYKAFIRILITIILIFILTSVILVFSLREVYLADTSDSAFKDHKKDYEELE